MSGEPFPSLEALKQAHRTLNRAYRDSGEGQAPEGDIKTFIEQSKRTGALLETEEERQDAQYLLDYWAAKLYSAESEPLDTTLAAFDAGEVPELSEDQYPFPRTESFLSGAYETYFERGAKLEKALALLEANRLLVVTGKFDSGVHSFVNGRLVPALESQAGPRDYLFIRPGETPLGQLARLGADAEAATFLDTPSRLFELLSAEAANPVILVVLQLEDVFWFCRDGAARDAFVQNVLGLIKAPGSEHAVIMTLDDSVRLSEDLATELRGVILHLDAPSMKHLYQAIKLSGESVGLKFDEGVLSSLVKDIAGEKDAFALLGLTLAELWRKRNGNRVTLDTYQSLGAAHRIFLRQAEQVFANLSEKEAAAAKDILLGLVELNKQMEPVSSPEPVAALIRKTKRDDALVRRTLEKLIRAGLVRRYPAESEDNTRIEIAHYSLVQDWPPLKTWVEQDEDFQGLLEVALAAEVWRTSGRDSKLLWKGEALEKARAYDKKLEDNERDFVNASIAFEQKQQGRSLRRVSFALAVVLVLTTAALWGWITAQSRSRQLARQNLAIERQSKELELRNTQLNASRLALEAQIQENSKIATLLALYANALDDQPFTRNALSLTTQEAYSKQLYDKTNPLQLGAGPLDLDLGENPRRVALPDMLVRDTRKRLAFSLDARRLTGTQEDVLYAALYSSADTALIAWIDRENVLNVAELEKSGADWGVRGVIYSRELGGCGEDGEQSNLKNLAFRDEGQLLYLLDACAVQVDFGTASDPEPVDLLESGTVSQFALSADGHLAAIDEEGNVHFYRPDGSENADLKSFKIEAGLVGSPAALSPGAKQLALRRTPQEVALWDVASGQLEGTLKLLDLGGDLEAQKTLPKRIVGLGYQALDNIRKNYRLLSIDNSAQVTSWSVDLEEWKVFACDLILEERDLVDQVDPFNIPSSLTKPCA